MFFPRERDFYLARDFYCVRDFYLVREIGSHVPSHRATLFLGETIMLTLSRWMSDLVSVVDGVVAVEVVAVLGQYLREHDVSLIPRSRIRSGLKD